jgi:hypothetical protein
MTPLSWLLFADNAEAWSEATRLENANHVSYTVVEVTE